MYPIFRCHTSDDALQELPYHARHMTIKYTPNHTGQERNKVKTRYSFVEYTDRHYLQQLFLTFPSLNIMWANKAQDVLNRRVPYTYNTCSSIAMRMIMSATNNSLLSNMH